MREAYERAAAKYLVTTEKEAVSVEKVLATFNKQFLIMSGYSEEETRKFDLAALTPEAIQELAKKKSMDALGLKGNHQKVVSMKELKDYIENGWEFVSALPNNEAIVRLPTH